MTLGELIAALEAADPTKVAPNGFANPHSYRGYYEDLAFEPARNITIGAMLAAARSAVGTTYQGWKGGDYTMTADTDVWLADEGYCGETLGPTLLRLILEGAQDAPSLRDRLREALTRPLPCPRCGSTRPCRCYVEATEKTDARLDALMAVLDEETR
ncbi:hypothetical protein SAMN04489712_105264 [Thermomonospora echinospora]|uniref:Uncharacterized protein n=1 Tax=Thermomonospora echinospora TaxID=1992 RepID=A0A1H6A7F0_9ACTN|nr:hypothetical protein [Thermomonospora echinospora]SEG44673.1 hypothetical protein SAMN04489712_105264 [Thermomonospora echinospora]